jgi:2Fe-2S ferredoxin
MRTSVPGIYAVGDVARYPGKLNLILSGFNEAALMSRSVYEYLNGEKARFQYSTHNDLLVGGSNLPATADVAEGQATGAAGIEPTGVALSAQEPHVLVTDVDGVEHRLPARPGRTLLELMDAAKIPVKGSCFGACNCSTCHVYIDEAWIDRLDPMIDQEQEALDQVAAPRAVSRLACQIEFRSDFSGLRLTLTEDTIPD